MGGGCQCWSHSSLPGGGLYPYVVTGPGGSLEDLSLNLHSSKASCSSMKLLLVSLEDQEAL